MVDSANVVTGFEFPHGRIVRGPRESFTAETSLPVTIFASFHCYSQLEPVAEMVNSEMW
jgi:hypothetical protein